MSVINFSAPIAASIIFQFFVHFQVEIVYCVIENYDANSHFAFFFKFLIFPSVTPIKNAYAHFSPKFSQQLLDLGL